MALEYIMMEAASDLRQTASHRFLVFVLGWQDVLKRYKRSRLGPFWLSISMAITIGTIGVVFGELFGIPLKDFLPFLSVGIILWNFMTQTIIEGAEGFIAAEGLIKQIAIPLPVHLFRVIFRNIVILGHNIVILPLVYFFLGKNITCYALFSFLGFLILIINLLWVCILLSVVCARFRDVPQMVTSLLQVLFYVTPIMWMPNTLPKAVMQSLLMLNPVFHLLEIVRAPLLGTAPTALNWQFSIALSLVGWLIALCCYGKYKKRIAYWI